MAYNFVGELDEELKCIICLEVATDPLQHEECGKLFCTDCLESYGKEKPCANCRTGGTHFYRDNRSKLPHLGIEQLEVHDAIDLGGTSKLF